VLRHYGWLGISIALMAAILVKRKEIKERINQKK
jgi:hypothetical protein